MRRDLADAAQDEGIDAARAGFSIEVELVTRRGQDWRPRPGRFFAASPANTFADLAEAIDVTFGRWDLGHLRMFVLPRNRAQLAGMAGPAGLPPAVLDGRSSRLDLLRPGCLVRLRLRP